MNFSGAAESLGISQPSVTLRIQEIEGRVGQRLFYRVGRDVAMTETGEQFLEYVNRVLRVWESGRGAVESGTDKAPLRLAAVSGAAGYLLPPFLKGWHDTNPNGSRVHVFTGSVKDVIHMVTDGVADVGIIRDGGGPIGFPLRSSTLYRDPIVAAINPLSVLLRTHRAESTVPMTLLASHPFIRYTSDEVDHVNETIDSRGFRPETVGEFSHAITVKRFIQSGAGIALLPYTSIAGELRSGHLAMLKAAEAVDLHCVTRLIRLDRPVQDDLFAFIAGLESYAERLHAGEPYLFS
jgi:DNA-binding transcriptional LysR family regulator